MRGQHRRAGVLFGLLDLLCRRCVYRRQVLQRRASRWFRSLRSRVSQLWRGRRRVRRDPAARVRLLRRSQLLGLELAGSAVAQWHVLPRTRVRLRRRRRLLRRQLLPVAVVGGRLRRWPVLRAHRLGLPPVRRPARPVLRSRSRVRGSDRRGRVEHLLRSRNRRCVLRRTRRSVRALRPEPRPLLHPGRRLRRTGNRRRIDLLRPDRPGLRRCLRLLQRSLHPTGGGDGRHLSVIDQEP